MVGVQAAVLVRRDQNKVPFLHDFTNIVQAARRSTCHDLRGVRIPLQEDRAYSLPESFGTLAEMRADVSAANEIDTEIPRLYKLVHIASTGA